MKSFIFSPFNSIAKEEIAMISFLSHQEEWKLESNEEKGQEYEEMYHDIKATKHVCKPWKHWNRDAQHSFQFNDQK